jgi:hypothetical protein
VSDAGNPAVKARAAARPTVKQHLAAIRMLFDWLESSGRYFRSRPRNNPLGGS